MNQLADRADCEIIREGDKVAIIDGGGNTIISYYYNLTDTEMWSRFEAACFGYRKGFAAGERYRQHIIQTALGI